MLSADDRALFVDDIVSEMASHVATVNGGQGTVPVILDKSLANALGVAQSNRTAVSFARSAYPPHGPSIGNVLEIGTSSYRIAAWADGSDDYVVTAILERTS